MSSYKKMFDTESSALQYARAVGNHRHIINAKLAVHTYAVQTINYFQQQKSPHGELLGQ